jgi:hypothetical protein
LNVTKQEVGLAHLVETAAAFCVISALIAEIAVTAMIEKVCVCVCARAYLAPHLHRLRYRVNLWHKDGGDKYHLLTKFHLYTAPSPKNSCEISSWSSTERIYLNIGRTVEDKSVTMDSCWEVICQLSNGMKDRQSSSIPSLKIKGRLFSVITLFLISVEDSESATIDSYWEIK